MRLILILNKGKTKPIGSVSPSGKTKKTVKGWVPVKNDVTSKKPIDLKSAVQWVLESTENKREAGVALNFKGKVITAFKGTMGEVNWGSKESAVRRAKTWVHNHPSNSSFSSGDLIMMLDVRNPVMIVATDNYNYTLKHNNKFPLPDVVMKELKKFDKTAIKDQKDIAKKQGLSMGEAGAERIHNRIKHVASIFGWDYERVPIKFKKSIRLILPISKAKARPTGSISPSGKYKKAPSGKWVPIKKESTKGNKIEKAVKEAYDWIFDRTDNKFEAMVLLNEKGEHVARKVGGKDHVDLDGMGPLMKGNTLLHNHPMGWSFSSSDLFVALTAGLKEIRAVGKEYEYIYRPDKVISRKDVYAITVFNKFFVKENSLLSNKYGPKVNSGELSALEANMQHYHELITNYVKYYGGFYERRKR